jgi:hypothetical protein
LAAEREALQGRVSEHNAKKAEKGSTAESTLLLEGGAIRRDMQAHATKSAAFNNAVGRAITRLQIEADQEAIRRLGFADRSAEFAAWEALTREKQDQLRIDALRILIRLGADELVLAVKAGTPALEKLTPAKAEELLKKLADAGITDPYFAEAVNAAAKAATKEDRIKAAKLLVSLCESLAGAAHGEEVLSSANKYQAGALTAFEVGSTVHSPQLRLLAGSAELTTVLAFSVAEQGVIQSRLEEMTNENADRLAKLQDLSARLRSHVREMKDLSSAK